MNTLQELRNFKAQSSVVPKRWRIYNDGKYYFVEFDFVGEYDYYTGLNTTRNRLRAFHTIGAAVQAILTIDTDAAINFNILDAR